VIWSATLLFLVILLELIGECAIELAELTTLVLVVKPMMMPALALYMFLALRGTKTGFFHKLIYGALFFSWLGDILLMVNRAGNDLFLFGLASFLIAHLLYIPAFRILPQRKERSLLASKPYAAFPVVIYFTGLLFSLFTTGSSEFTEMQLPVVLYALVIMIMVLSALNRKNRVSEVSYNLVFFGALLFMFSDSLIAINKFTNVLEDSPLFTRIAIMSTYAIGQFLIVEGSIRQEETDHSG